jgi:O-antigen ligase
MTSAQSRSWQISIALFLLSAFLLVSRVLDLLAKSFKIPAVLLCLFGLSFLASRRFLAFWNNTAGKIMPIFMAWVLLAWFMNPRAPGSSFYMQSLLAGAVLFAAAAGLFTTTTGFSKLFATLSASGLLAAFLGLIWSRQGFGRVSLRAGAYSDPNYYALWLLAVIPLIWPLIAQKSIPVKLIGIFASLLTFVSVLRTGSRAALVSLAVMLAVVFVLSSLRIRILILSVTAVAFVIAVAFVPNALQTRLGVSTSDRSGADQNSASARETLLVSSLALTFGNPVFGIGPGNFAESIVEEGRSRGLVWASLGTHNSYTQISSETGIPGILLMLLLIGFSLRNIISLLRQTRPLGESPDLPINQLARAMLVSLAGVCTFMFFLAEAYNSLVYLWLGLASGLRLLLPEPESDDEFIEMEEQPAPAP